MCMRSKKISNVNYVTNLLAKKSSQQTLENLHKQNITNTYVNMLRNHLGKNVN